jgi:hypothetical protein
MNLSATHFIQGLNIPSSSKSTRAIHGKNAGVEDNNSSYGDTSDEEDNTDEYDNDNEFDIDVNMEIEATPDDVEAMLGTTITDFEAGDVVGKLMAFVNQLRASSEPTRDFLKQLCRTNECKPRDLKLWVRTRWGSLSDCFEVVLNMRAAIDDFCALADGKFNLPPLNKPKKWQNFQLEEEEWVVIELAYKCLRVCWFILVWCI